MNETLRKRLAKEVKESMDRQGRVIVLRHRPTDSPSELAWEEHEELNQGYFSEPDKETLEKIKQLSQDSEPE